MTIGIGSNVQVLRTAESTWGTTPITPAGIVTRMTGITLNPVKDVFESKEIRSDRQTADLRHGILMAQGDLDFELCAADYDDLFESLMFGTWSSDVLKVGSTRKSFTMEIGHTGITQYLKSKGVVVDKLAISFKPGEIVSGKFTLMGKDFARGTSTYASSTTAASTNSPYDTFSGTMLEGGGSIGYLGSMDLNVDNQLEVAKVLGSSSLYDIQPGRAKVSGNLVGFFQDGALLDKFLNETASSLSVQAAGGTKSMTFLLSNLKYTAGKVDVTKEGLLQVDMSFSGLQDATNTCLKLTRDNT